jgi:hypothetical protein
VSGDLGAARTVDYAVREWARIRLRDARERDILGFERRFGLPAEEPSGPADLTIRFVGGIEVGRPLRIASPGEAAFAGDAFVALDRRGRPRAVMPLDRLGDDLEIVCRTGSGVPQLSAILNLVLLDRGVLALHASAAVWNGIGVAAAGWSKGGKTEALLALVSNGAAAIADEWTYVTDDRRMTGLAEPIRVHGWHLAELPELGTSLGGEALRARLAGAVAAAGERLARGPGGGALRRAVGPVHDREAIDVAPARLFGAARLADDASLDRLLFVVAHDAPDIVVTRVDAAEVAARMTASLTHHRSAFMDLYWQFAFAFPNRRNPRIEHATAREAELLHARLSGVPAVEIAHPPRPSLRALGGAIARAVERNGVG